MSLWDRFDIGWGEFVDESTWEQIVFSLSSSFGGLSAVNSSSKKITNSEVAFNLESNLQVSLQATYNLQLIFGVLSDVNTTSQWTATTSGAFNSLLNVVSDNSLVAAYVNDFGLSSDMVISEQAVFYDSGVLQSLIDFSSTPGVLYNLVSSFDLLADFSEDTYNLMVEGKSFGLLADLQVGSQYITEVSGTFNGTVTFLTRVEGWARPIKPSANSWEDSAAVLGDWTPESGIVNNGWSN